MKKQKSGCLYLWVLILNKICRRCLHIKPAREMLWVTLFPVALLLSACGNGSGSGTSSPHASVAVSVNGGVLSIPKGMTQLTHVRTASSPYLVMTIKGQNLGSGEYSLNIFDSHSELNFQVQGSRVNECQVSANHPFCTLIITAHANANVGSDEIKIQSVGGQRIDVNPSVESIQLQAQSTPKSSYVMHIRNTLKTPVHSVVNFKLTTDSNELLLSQDTLTLSPGAIADYSVCGSWHDTVTQQPSLELIKGSACVGQAKNGSEITGLQYWTSDLPQSVDISADNDQSPNKTEIILSTDHKTVTNFSKGTNTLLITSPTAVYTADLQVGSSLSSDPSVSYTLTQGHTQVSAGSALNRIIFDQSMHPVLSANYYGQPFEEVVFSGSGGDQVSSYAITGNDTILGALVHQHMQAFQPPGWPNYVASGAIDDFSPNTIAGIEARKTVDSIFKYAGNDGAGDNGKDPYSLFYSTAKAVIKTVDAAQTFTQKLGHAVIPVAVVYTTNASGGDQKQAELQVSSLPLLTQHFSYLALVGLYMEHHPVAPSVFGSVVLNPDTYGEGHKDGYYAATPCPAHSGLLAMVQYLSSHNNSSGAPLLTAQQVAQMTAQINSLFPSDSGNFATYNQALNWIMHTLAPHVAYGMADNVWAGDTSGHAWLHTANSKIAGDHAQAEATYLMNNGVYGNNASFGNPTFIAFDKYERNTFVRGNTPLNVYVYNNNDWGTYMNYVSAVAQKVAGQTSLPIMLFQIPGGHIAPSSESNWQYGATAPDYFLGDSSVCNATTNPGVEQALQIPLPAIFGTDNVSNYPTYLAYLYAPEHYQSYNQMANAKKPCLMGGHMADLIQDHVFAVLWGGGSTTSIAGPQDDGGYLSQLIKSAKHYTLDGKPMASSPYAAVH